MKKARSMLFVRVDVPRKAHFHPLPLSTIMLCAAASMSCVRLGYDTIEYSEAPGGSGPGASGGMGGNAGTQSAGRSNAAQGGTGMAAIGGQAGVGGGAGNASGGTSSVSPTCSVNRSYTKVWTWDTNEEGWVMTLDSPQVGTMAWTGAIGHTSSGALSANVTLGGSLVYGYFRNSQSNLGNLSGKTITAYV